MISPLEIIILESELGEIKKEILDLRKRYRGQLKSISEAEGYTPTVLDGLEGDLDYVFDEAKKRFNAAQRAVGLANKLNDPKQKQIVWKSLNMLRGFIKNLEKQIDQRYEMMLSQVKNGSNPDRSPGVVSDDVRRGTFGGR